MSKNDGGSAFPMYFGDQIQPQGGITVRTYLAAKAMQAMISTAGAPCLFGLEGGEASTAAAAYKMADAMIAESWK